MLREAVDGAIRRLTPVDVPVGAHVSGGLDCTSVACRANQVLGEQGRSLVAGYSWAPREQDVPRFPGDERELLDAVSEQEGFPVRRVPNDDSGDWFFRRDPFSYLEATHVFERFVLPQAQADGVRVMLSGWGGDELASFNGRAVNDHLVRSGQLLMLWRESGRRAEVLAGGPVALRSRLRRLVGIVGAAGPEWLTGLRHPVGTVRRARAEREFAAALRSVAPLAAEVLEERRKLVASARDHHEYQLVLLELGHLHYRTTWWHQTGSLFGIEYRYPLLDPEVIRTALQLPWWAYASQGWTRVAYRMAVEPWVPASVAWNVSKYEPSRMSPPSGHPGRQGPTPPGITDERYLRLLDRAAIAGRRPRGRRRPHTPQRSAPHLRPG